MLDGLCCILLSLQLFLQWQVTSNWAICIPFMPVTLLPVTLPPEVTWKCKLYVTFYGYTTLRKGSSAESMKSVCLRYSFPTLVWNAAKLYGCFIPEWDNPHGGINFSWFALTFLSPSTDMDLICVLLTLPFLPLQVSVSGFCISAIWSTIPIPVFFLLILSTAVADYIVFYFLLKGRGWNPTC